MDTSGLIPSNIVQQHNDILRHGTRTEHMGRLRCERNLTREWNRHSRVRPSGCVTITYTSIVKYEEAISPILSKVINLIHPAKGGCIEAIGIE